MDASSSPLQGGTPAEPAPDPAAVWQEILSGLEERYPGISGGDRNRALIAHLSDSMAGRSGLPASEPEAGQ